MKTNITCAIIALFVFATSSLAQNNSGDVYWRIDPSVKSCSMVLDRSLTQAQWKTFVTQVSAISSFKSLRSAEPLGAMHFSIGLSASQTPVNQHDLAWINTFVHPDAECPLGDDIQVPTLRARMGVSDDIDVGAYWITAPNANYGMVGGEVQYRFLKESDKLPAAAIRASATILTGVSDFDLNVYTADVIVSKEIAMFTPYVGLRGNLSIGTPTTSKVQLDKETLLLPQGYAGVSYSVWILALAAEYDVASVNTFALSAGLNF